MRFLIIAVALASGAMWARAGKDVSMTCDAGRPVALIGGDVLTMESPYARRGATVIVAGGRITAVGNDVSVPDDACRIDARGKTVLPGLADMHVHTTEREMPLYLANGVTTVREMNGSPAFVALRENLDAGWVGPRLLIASPLLAGVRQRFRHELIESVTDARKAAHEAERLGYDYLKIYDGLSRESYDALVEASTTVGIPLDGHIPEAVGIERVLEVGQTIEHMDKIAVALSGHQPDTSVLPRARELFTEHPVWVTPTVASLHALDIAGTDEYSARLERPEMAYVDGATMEWWGSLRRSRSRPPGGSPFYRLELALLRVLHEVGVPLLLGTDTGNPLMVAGFAVHDELERLVADAGFSRYDALRTATANVGRFLHEPGTGMVQVGTRADLLLVEGDPLKDLGVLRSPVGVMANSRWLDRAALDEMLRKAR
jgi:cytosine/adenosine deaminase-related metal-dependent hydrolase